MLLRRLGNKSKIAKKIQYYFPKHTTYIEPFFGAGGILFNKPKAKYNIVNDLESDVYNLYQVVKNNHKELEQAFYNAPYHLDLWNYYKKNECKTAIDKAVRFLFLSNFGFLGQPVSLRLQALNNKKITYENIKRTFDFIFDIQFSNTDFEKFLNSIALKRINEIKTTFIYCDPPYLNTGSNYSNSFAKSDVIRLFNVLDKLKCKFAYSEFKNDFIMQEAKKRNYNIIIIGERKSLKNRNTEILITNYKNQMVSLF